MAWLVIDVLSDPAQWIALAPDGVTPSTELTLVKDTRVSATGGASSIRLSAGSGAANHTLRRDLPVTVDLQKYDELRLLFRSDRPADGTSSAPFYLELRLGAAVLPPDSASNTFRRLLPATRAGAWDIARFSLGDLAPAVRAALLRIQFRSIGNAPYVCNFDTLAAARDEMFADADSALLGLLDKRLAIGANPVPAVLHPANGVLNQGRPYFQILHLDIYFSNERTQSARANGDFVGDTYSLRPPSFAYELYYQITAVADDRATQARMLEFALQALTPRGELFVNGYHLPMEMVTIPPRERIGAARTDELPIYFKISSRQEVGVAETVRAARNVILQADLTT